MTVEIKEGRYYRDRMGQVHGPMIRHVIQDQWPWTTRQGLTTWTAYGYIFSTGDEQKNDLVEEVRIVPVNSEGETV